MERKLIVVSILNVSILLLNIFMITFFLLILPKTITTLEKRKELKKYAEEQYLILLNIINNIRDNEITDFDYLEENYVEWVTNELKLLLFLMRF
jgi:hypothetical protein